MKRNDNRLKENYVFVPKWYCKSRNNRCQDIQKLGCTVEFMGLMDQKEEGLVNGLSNHLSSWDQFGIELMQDVLQVISLNRFF